MKINENQRITNRDQKNENWWMKWKSERELKNEIKIRTKVRETRADEANVARNVEEERRVSENRRDYENRKGGERGGTKPLVGRKGRHVLAFAYIPREDSLYGVHCIPCTTSERRRETRAVEHDLARHYMNPWNYGNPCTYAIKSRRSVRVHALRCPRFS